MFWWDIKSVHVQFTFKSDHIDEQNIEELQSWMMRELIAKAHQYSGSTSEKLIMRGMTVVGTLKNNMYV